MRKLMNEDMTEKEQAAIFESIDLDGQETITFEEFRTAMLASSGMRDT